MDRVDGSKYTAFKGIWRVEGPDHNPNWIWDRTLTLISSVTHKAWTSGRRIVWNTRITRITQNSRITRITHKAWTSGEKDCHS